jgi:transposase
MWTREEALAIYRAGPEAVVEALCGLSVEVDRLAERLKELERQLATNSTNSSKPPSSDGPHKPKPRSLRPRGQRKPGGQKGHQGHTLKMVEHPDHTIVHRVDECEKCGASLAGHKPTRVDKRQVFDAPPPPALEVTEHQAETKPCPQCGHVNKAAFPEGVKAPAQYGPRVKAVVTYLRQYQLVPSQRTCELVSDLFSWNLSEGTLTNILEAAAGILAEPVAEIARDITAAPVAHFDETGCSVNAKRQWLHVACTDKLTHYQAHPKRGTEAMDHIGILPNFTGRAIHDHWKPYFTYPCEHGLCNAHHLRELIFVHEQHGQSWAEHMIDCLLAIKETVEKARNTTDHLPQEQIRQFEARYQRILDEGYAQNPLPQRPPGKKKRGRQKKSKPRNLLERLDQFRKEALAFMYDFNVPFDNNQAERDGRMMKVQQKISGTFRSEAGAEGFCRVRSYISTVRKHAVNVIEALLNAFVCKPFVLLRPG